MKKCVMNLGSPRTPLLDTRFTLGRAGQREFDLVRGDILRRGDVETYPATICTGDLERKGYCLIPSRHVICLSCWQGILRIGGFPTIGHRSGLTEMEFGCV